MTKPIIPWIGGKRRLAKHIIPLFPKHVCYCEPFCGAAALFFMKPSVSVEILNDINGELVNLYRITQHHLEEFIRQFKYSQVSRQMFKWLKITDPETLTDIQRAARFYYLQKLSFGGKVVGQAFGTATTSPPRLNLLRIEEDLSGAHLRLARACIEHLSWKECIKKYDRPQTLFYIDPPYWQTEGYGTPFPLEQYELLAKTMKEIKGKAILSINKHQDMEDIFKDFQAQEVNITYTAGKANNRSERKELIIRNW